MASDNDGNPAGAAFVEEVLGVKLANAFGTNTGCIADMPFSKDMNPDIYCVERPDGFQPAGKGARTWLRYPGTPLAAAVYNQGGNCKAVTLGVPVETVIRPEDRQWILGQALGWIYDGKKPAVRR